MNQQHVLETLSRRQVLAWGGGTALLTASVGGCGFLSTDPETEGDKQGGGGGDTGAKESPALAEKVEAGELPPLEERLPEEPLVVEVGEPGIYGGTFASVTLGPGDGASFDRITGYQPPLRKNVMITETIPSAFKDIERNEEGTEYTLLLRKGMRWSDGEPFTADDVIFVIEDIYGNEELNATPPTWLSTDGELAKAEKVDDATVKVTFAKPTGLFRDTCDRDMALIRYAKHYCKDFLPKYNKNLDKKVKDAGLEGWPDLWNDLIGGDGPWKNPDMPLIFPWIVTVPLGEENKVVFERNPYFWKTDPDGRQLPYMDTLSFEVVTDPEVMTLKAADGELDLLFRHANSPANKPVYAKAREDAGINLVDTTATSMNTMCIALNLAHKNKKKAKLYQNKDFRIGLSHAINREELITGVWQRQGEPWQWAPTKDSIYYDEEFAKQYTEYDVAKANEHLDKAGITEKDGKGFRKMPDGSALTITLDIATALFDEWPAAADIIQGSWKEVGIRLSVNTIDRTLFYDRKVSSANEHDAGVWGGDGGLAVEAIDPRWYMPFSDESIWATPWAAYFNSRGSGGTEPIPRVKEQIELFWELQATPAEEERVEIFRKVLAIAKEEFWGIGIGSAPNPYWVAKNRLKNVTGGVPDTYVYRTPGHANPETWFINEDA